MSRHRLLCLSIAVLPWAAVEAKEMAGGSVFIDKNRDGTRDTTERGLPNVRVSNGRAVTLTDAEGQYRLSVDDGTVLFVIKPRDYSVPVNKEQLPQFYYVHRPQGSPTDLKYAGVKPTGVLPAAIDFPLYERPEEDEFDVIVLGDPQPRTIEDVDSLAEDVVPELIESSAAFTTAVGDVVYDHLDLYKPLNQALATTGRPFFAVAGNHDVNEDVHNDTLSNETWKRVYGPPDYSFDWGAVHFIVLENVVYRGEGKGYHGGFNSRQLEFVANDLALVSPKQLVVLLMHIPLRNTRERAKLFKLFENRPHTLSFAGHTHDLEHLFFDSTAGWPNETPHHHVVAGALCGMSWGTLTDELGVPTTITSCGSPNGYVVATFKGNSYSLRFKAPRRPSGEQIRIHAPRTIATAMASTTEVVANVFFGSRKSRTDMKVDDGPWVVMQHTKRKDPYLLAKGGHPTQVAHFWVAKLPEKVAVGTHVIRVRTVDMFGQRYEATRLLRVVE